MESTREKLRAAEEAWAEAAAARGEAQADLETARSRARQAAADALAARQHARGIAGAAGEALRTARGALRRYRFHLREKLSGLLPREAGDWAGQAGARAAEDTRRLVHARARGAAGPGDPEGTGVRLGDVLSKRRSAGSGHEDGGDGYDVDADRVQPEYEPGLAGGLLLGPGGGRAGPSAADGPLGHWAENPNVLVSVSDLVHASAALRQEEVEDEVWLDTLAQVPAVKAWFQSQAEAAVAAARQESGRQRQQLARLEDKLADAERRIGPAVEAARRDGISSAGLKVRVAQLQERATAAERKVEELASRCRDQEERAGHAEGRARDLDERLDRTSRELREKQAALKAASRAHLSIAEAAESAQLDDEYPSREAAGVGGGSMAGRWGGGGSYGQESKSSDAGGATFGGHEGASRVSRHWGQDDEEEDSYGRRAVVDAGQPGQYGTGLGYGQHGGGSPPGRVGERVRQQVREAVDHRLSQSTSHLGLPPRDRRDEAYPQRVQAVPPPSAYGTPSGPPSLAASGRSLHRSAGGYGKGGGRFARTPVGAQLEHLAQSLESMGTGVRRL